MPFRGNDLFMWKARVCAILWGMNEEKNIRICRKRESFCTDAWAPRFLVSHWAQISRYFCNFSLSHILMKRLVSINEKFVSVSKKSCHASFMFLCRSLTFVFSTYIFNSIVSQNISFLSLQPFLLKETASFQFVVGLVTLI